MCLCISISFAQIPENIASDRPGNAYTSTTVGKGVFQGQDGIEFGHAKLRTSIATNTITLRNDNYINVDNILQTSAFTNYYRFGLGNRSEINAAFDYRYSENYRISSDNRQSGNYLSGLSKLSLGFRQNILQEKGNAPALGILVNANFNGLLNDYRDANPDGFVLVLAQKQLSNVFSVTTNLGFNIGDIFNQEELANGFLYTLNLGYSITPKLSGYVEGYGLISDGRVIDYYDTGFGYLLGPDIQLDLYAGINYEENYFEYFVSTGVSFRFGAN